MPVSENLMIGFALGLSLKEFKPVVFIERMDFILNALDAIVNHLDKIKEKSNNEFQPAVLIRCIVGNKNKPLYTGITHTQDYSEALKKMVSFSVLQIKKPEEVKSHYETAINNLKNNVSTILVEYKDLI
jgi:pyruvate/2-oxoglutarate/acetoin dehydrogenase E1 component